MMERPPKLEGGFSLRVDAIDESHACLTVEHGDARVELRAAVLSSPYPSGLEQLLASEPDVDAVLVERVPPGLAAAARDRGVSYVALQGEARVVGPGLAYFSPPRAPRADRGTASRTSAFAPKASRVVRALLSDPPRAWRLSDLAGLVQLNPGNVHRVLASLQARGFVDRDRDRYLVSEPGSLLDAWAENARPPKERAVLVSGGDVQRTVLDLIEHLEGRAVVSGELAAELLAPHLPARSAIVHCLDADRWEHPSPDQLPPQAARALVTHIVIDLADEGVAQFGSSAGGFHVVSPAQLYVDLAHEPTRGRQAAEEVRRQLLGY